MRGTEPLWFLRPQWGQPCLVVACGLGSMLSVTQEQGLGCLPPYPLPTQSQSLIPADAAVTPVESLAWCWQSLKEKEIILSPVT